MGLVAGIVVYTCLWWVIFFMTLPFSVEQERSPERGHDVGAPKKPYLLTKFLITTLLATICWFGVDYLIRLHLIPLRE